MPKKYVSVSGGADSTAAALLLWERGEDFEMVFSDTGAELPETYWMLPRLATHIGEKLYVVSNGTFFQHFANFGYLSPAPTCRYCTRLLKMVPQERFFAAMEAETVAIGIRADEPHRVHDKPRVKGQPQPFYPLVDAGMDKADVKKLCAKYDLLSPAYAWRTNISCFCCFFQRKNDWLGLLRHHPELFQLAEKWEAISKGKTGKNGLHGITQYWWGGNTKSLFSLRATVEDQIRWCELDEEPCTICTV